MLSLPILMGLKKNLAMNAAKTPIEVAIVMGSTSDFPTMRAAAEVLRDFGIAYEAKVVSAHRTPERLELFAKEAEERGVKVIIAGAGGAAHLPGMIAAFTTLPVVGVPVQSKALSGMDSLLSIVQMPGGVPVGTMAIGTAGAKNAGLFAARILGAFDIQIAEQMKKYREELASVVPDEPLTLDEA